MNLGFRLVAALGTFLVCLGSGYWLGYDMRLTAMAGLLLGLVTYTALALASRTPPPSRIARRNLSLVTAVLFAALGVINLLAPGEWTNRTLAWMSFGGAALYLLLAWLHARRPAGR